MELTDHQREVILCCELRQVLAEGGSGLKWVERGEKGEWGEQGEWGEKGERG